MECFVYQLKSFLTIFIASSIKSFSNSSYFKLINQLQHRFIDSFIIISQKLLFNIKTTNRNSSIYSSKQKLHPQIMIFKKQMSSCPFNPAHTFEKQKFVFHISRCKDKQKMMPLMGKCKYNPLHYVMKDKLALHQQVCLDKKYDQENISKYQANFRKAERQHVRGLTLENDRSFYTNRQERSRSRDKDQQKIEEDLVKEEKLQKLQDNAQNNQEQHEQASSDDSHTFSDCEECQEVLNKYRSKIVQNRKLVKIIKKYQQAAGYSIL